MQATTDVAEAATLQSWRNPQAKRIDVPEHEHEPVLQTPDKRDDIPVQVIEYLNYKEEITLHNGILFKSQRIIIPKG